MVEVIKAKLSPLNISRLPATYVTSNPVLLFCRQNCTLWPGVRSEASLPHRLLPRVTICTSGPSKASQAGSAPEPEPGVTLSGRRRALVGRLRQGRRRRAGDSLSWPERAEISPHSFPAWYYLPPSSLHTSPRGLTTR